MNLNVLLGSQVIQHIPATAAGTTTITPSGIINCAGAESVLFIASFGALTATQQTTIKVQGGNLANGSDMADLANTHPGYLLDSQSNTNLAVEIVRPTYQYLRCIVVRGTANAVLNCVNAIVFNRARSPIQSGDIDATMSAQTTVISPAYGTF